MGRKYNIPDNVKNEIIEYINNSRDMEFIKFVIDSTREYKNEKQTFELLAEVASLPCIQNIKPESNIVFSEDAENLIGYWTNIYKYQDPDAKSLLLYMLWGQLLKSNGTIDDYKIKYINYSFELNCTYTYNNQKEDIRLGTDAISKNNIEKHGLPKDTFKSLGSFLIWPKSGQGGFNSKKALLNGGSDSIECVLEKIKNYYEGDESFIKNEYDQKWFKYLGGCGNQNIKYKRFCKRLLITDAEFDSNGLFTAEYIRERNKKMYQIINGINGL